MTQEQINRLHELEDERHYLFMRSFDVKPHSDIEVTVMERLELKKYISDFAVNIEDMSLLREMADKIKEYFYNFEDHRQKRLAEIKKEIEAL